MYAKRTSEKNDNSQRKNLFHTRCFVNGKMYAMIVDGVIMLMLLAQSWLISWDYLL